MRIAVFSFDFPYPPNRGGRADIWRRLLALKQLGHQVLLVTWHLPGHPPEPALVDKVASVVDGLLLFPARGGPLNALDRLYRLHKWPSFVSARRLNRTQLAEVESAFRSLRPDLVWCEGPYPGAAAQQAIERAKIPLVYRSHNIEHLYMRRQARAAIRWRDRLAWHIACIGLDRFETRLIEQATWVFDISCDDMAFWQQRGARHISWLPPLAESALSAVADTAALAAPLQHDVVFLGNLTTPNNIRGIEWLVNEIRPLVSARRPGTDFVVAGSNPGPHVRQLCAAAGVQLMANVPDALALYRSARVLVNPVRTGSGTHVKAIEMLMMSTPIVTATQGTQGMPPAVKRLFRVADTADAFAEQVLQALDDPQDLWADRAEARRLFGVDGLADAMALLQQQLDAGQPT